MGSRIITSCLFLLSFLSLAVVSVCIMSLSLSNDSIHPNKYSCQELSYLDDDSNLMLPPFSDLELNPYLSFTNRLAFTLKRFISTAKTNYSNSFKIIKCLELNQSSDRNLFIHNTLLSNLPYMCRFYIYGIRHLII